MSQIFALTWIKKGFNSDLKMVQLKPPASGCLLSLKNWNLEHCGKVLLPGIKRSGKNDTKYKNMTYDICVLRVTHIISITHMDG